jgi:hypothetical protein
MCISWLCMYLCVYVCTMIVCMHVCMYVRTYVCIITKHPLPGLVRVQSGTLQECNRTRVSQMVQVPAPSAAHTRVVKVVIIIIILFCFILFFCE